MFEEKHDFRGCGFFRIFEHLDFWTFDHCILYSCLCSFSLWQQGFFSTKQLMVYGQITFFIKSSCFHFGFFPKTPCFLAVNMGYTGPNSKGDHLGFPRVLGQIYSVFFWGFFGTGFCEKRGEYLQQNE